MNNASLLATLPKPQPSGGQDNYDSIIQKRLNASPFCAENYRRFKQTNNHAAEINYLPVRLDIENVSRCNFACSMCQVSLWDKGVRANDMSFDTFCSLIDDLPSLVEIKIQGFGEPLLAAYTFFEMIKYARNQLLWVRSTINGSLLHVNNNVSKIIDSDINEVTISLDGATKATFESIRHKSNFDQVVRNSELIASELIKRGSSHILKFNTTLQSLNFHEQRSLIDLVSSIGGSNLTFTYSISEFGDPEWHKRNDSKEMSLFLDYNECVDLVSYATSKGVNLTFWAGLDKYNASKGDICPWPFSRLYISSDARLVPCCIIGNPDTYEFNSDRTDTLGNQVKDLWNSSTMKQFREAHINNDIPDVCKYCYVNCK